MKKNSVYKRLSTLTCVGCCIRVEKWMLSQVAKICRSNGVSAQVDDESLADDKLTCSMVIVAEGNDAEQAYMEAGWDLHNELGIDLA